MTRTTLIAGVCERDIDLLLLEEFEASPDFRSWFLMQALETAPTSVTYLGAQRSVTHSSGESDLEVDFIEAGGTRFRLMIENKVGAGLQPAQADRYRIRGASYIGDGKCARFKAVIVAPSKYFGVSPSRRGFDACIAYEDLCEWFESAAHLGDRRKYKVLLLQSAIAKGTLGYQPDADHVTTDFWRGYWTLATRYAPELEMPEPASKPSGAGFIWFRPPSLPKGMSICHKFNRGYVDLQFPGMGDRLNELHARYGQRLGADMLVVKAAKSGAVRLQVPLLDGRKPIAAQESAVKDGLASARRLLGWFLAERKH